MGSAVIVQIVLAVLGSGGFIAAIAALRKGKIDGDNTSMATLNERLNADNLLLRQEVREMRAEMATQQMEIVELRNRISDLEHDLREATK